MADDSKRIAFEFTWYNFLPQRKQFVLFNYVDGEKYTVFEDLDIIGNFSISEGQCGCDEITTSVNLKLSKREIKELEPVKYISSWKKIK